MIHVCYALRDESGKYTKFVGTSMVSIFENTAEFVTIHVVHDSSVSKENRDKLVEIVQNYGQSIAFYDIDKLSPNRMDEVRKDVPRVARHWASIACFYRLMIQNFLPADVSKVIYLDADVIVNHDIKDYWDVNLEGKPFAAVQESLSGVEDFNLKKFVPVKIGRVDWKDYFNAGVFILDLDQARKNPERDLLTRCLKFLIEHPDSTHLDQDALNFVFAGNYKQLPVSFNHLVNYVRKLVQPNRVEPESYHYIVDTLGLNMKDVYNKFWFKYFIKSPFCTPQIFWSLREAVDKYIVDYQKIGDSHIKRAEKIFKLAIDRPRTFFMPPENAQDVPKMFGLAGKEVGINANSPSALNSLIIQMKTYNAPDSNNKRLYLIFVEPKKYEEIRDKLKSEGFKEDEDFANLDGLFAAPKMNLPGQNSFVRKM